jgi:hypothetical protein
MKLMSKRERERRLLRAWSSINEAITMSEAKRLDDNDRINLDTEISDAENELKAVRAGLWPPRPESNERRW